MTRKVYFSFHYSKDISRVSRIRNAGTLDKDGQPFIDKAEWEKLKRSGDSAIEKWIKEQMHNTSVLILCIGEETYKRGWVKYEIQKAHADGRGIVGIYMNGMKDFNQNTIGKGYNPLDDFSATVNGSSRKFSQIYKTYSWVDDNGYENIYKWIEEAAKNAGR